MLPCCAVAWLYPVLPWRTSGDLQAPKQEHRASAGQYGKGAEQEELRYGQGHPDRGADHDGADNRADAADCQGPSQAGNAGAGAVADAGQCVEAELASHVGEARREEDG